MNKLCSKIDTCYKIDMIKDKDMLDFQFADAVREVCGKCEDFTVGGREMTEKTDRLLKFKERIKVTDEALKEHYRLSMECKRVPNDYLLMMTEGGDCDAVAAAIAKAQDAKTAELTRKEMVEELGDIWAELQDYLTPSVGSLLMVDRGDLTKIEIRIEALKGS